MLYAHGADLRTPNNEGLTVSHQETTDDSLATVVTLAKAHVSPPSKPRASTLTLQVILVHDNNQHVNMDGSQSSPCGRKDSLLICKSSPSLTPSLTPSLNPSLTPSLTPSRLLSLILQPFHCACENGHLDFVLWMHEKLSAGKESSDRSPPAHLTAKNNYGHTPMGHACHKNRLDACEFLIRQGPSPPHTLTRRGHR